MNRNDTIYALASAPGMAGVAVIRISGGLARHALEALIRGSVPPPRLAAHRRLFPPAQAGTGEAEENLPIDDGLVIWFPGPASFTGEDVAELHIHGGRACLAAVTQALAAIAGLRPAEAGEFTRRAFENAKLDLTRAEALADLVAAETEAQRRQAMGQYLGALAERYEAWAQSLIGLCGELEAAIDFSDEDLPDGLISGIFPKISALAGEIEAHLNDNRRGERLREGVRAVILGAPNVGKSSLLNRLAGRDAAIVSETAGTTRDVIEVHLDLGGLPVTVADTAGLREAVSDVEIEGIRRARARAAESDLKILVFDAEAWPALDGETRDLADGASLLILNKVDLRDPRKDASEMLYVGLGGEKLPIYSVSARTEAGLAEVLAALEAMARARMGPGQGAPITRARHRAALVETFEALRRAAPERPVEFNAEDLRLAARSLGRITGRIDVEDV
ncbi:MAG: tRNA uridine-5-carboxymethylaminomethyl(34) synthesis GTPase MnmE, partial [Alphaproteobacteria bacterium]|nr:tRNA uridine-5-carboxymethylaminomethyl(34) synthesis GTPase MnmE [Alphaproteobacteria bacterium]